MIFGVKDEEMTLGVDTIKIKKYKKNQAKQLGIYGWVG
jgi:hypothetical protein